MNLMNHSRNSRRAVSLAELLVVMTACTIILSMSSVLIHRVTQAHSKTRAFLDDERSALRLSDQFRRDVHQSIDATISIDGLGESQADGEVLQLVLPGDEMIDYRHDAGLITRVLKKAEQPLSREEYAFPSHIALALHEEASPRRLILSITSKPAPTLGPITPVASPTYVTPISVQIEATLGRSVSVPVVMSTQASPE